MMETISVKVDTDIARAFQLAQPEEQEKIQALMSFWLRRAMSSAKLLSTMDSMSHEAKSNGLTPEILQSILDE